MADELAVARRVLPAYQELAKLEEQADAARAAADTAAKQVAANEERVASVAQSVEDLQARASAGGNLELSIQQKQAERDGLVSHGNDLGALGKKLSDHAALEADRDRAATAFARADELWRNGRVFFSQILP